jgi:hypothetical protein
MAIGEPGSVLVCEQHHHGVLQPGVWRVSAKLNPDGTVTCTVVMQATSIRGCVSDPIGLADTGWELLSSGGVVRELRCRTRLVDMVNMSPLHDLLASKLGDLGKRLVCELLELVCVLAGNMSPCLTWEQLTVRFRDVNDHRSVIQALTQMLPPDIRPRERTQP